MASSTHAAAAPRGPLDGRALPAGSDFSLGVAPAASRWLLRGDAETAARAGAAFGVTPSLHPHVAASLGARAALWLGPDEFLLLAEPDASVARDIAAALADRPHSLVDISERQLGLVAAGPVAARALNAGCPLDLRERAFPVGTATRTMLAKAEIVLWRQAPQRFHIEVWRSFADYAVTYLAEAARLAPRG